MQMTEATNETNKKAAPTEAAKSQPKPKPAPQALIQDEVYTAAPSNETQAAPYLPNKAWLILLPIAFVGTITTVSLIFTGSNSSYQQHQLQELQTEYKGYQTGVKDAR